MKCLEIILPTFILGAVFVAIGYSTAERNLVRFGHFVILISITVGLLTSLYVFGNKILNTKYEFVTADNQHFENGYCWVNGGLFESGEVKCKTEDGIIYTQIDHYWKEAK